MLGRNYRFSVNNQAGVNVGVVIQRRAWKFATSPLRARARSVATR